MAVSVVNWNSHNQIECAHLTARNAAFPLHTHEEYAISANLSGVEQLSLHQQTLTVHAGEITLYNPETLQASQFGDRPVEFFSVHLPQQVFADLADRAPPILREGVLRDPQLFAAICGFAQSPQEQEVQQQNLLWLTSQLLKYSRDDALLSAPESLGQALECMRDNLTSKLTLDQLAAAAGLSKFHFVRQFRQQMGIAPLQYHMQLRLLAARNLLRHQHGTLEVAHRLGFYDQSHFINSFRKMMGITPHQYLRLIRR